MGLPPLLGWAGPGRGGCSGERQAGCSRGRGHASRWAVQLPFPHPSEMSQSPFLPLNSNLKALMFLWAHPRASHFWFLRSEHHPTDLQVPTPSRSCFCSNVTFSGSLSEKPPVCDLWDQPTLRTLTMRGLVEVWRVQDPKAKETLAGQGDHRSKLLCAMRLVLGPLPQRSGGPCLSTCISVLHHFLGCLGNPVQSYLFCTQTVLSA